MKIKSQFLIFVCGIVLLPVIFIGIVVVMNYYEAPQRALVMGYDEIQEQVGDKLDKEVLVKLYQFVQKRPLELDFIFLDKNSVIIFSTIPEFQEKTKQKKDIFSYVKETGSKYMYQFDFPELQSEKDFFVITRIDRTIRKSPTHFIKMFRIIQTLLFLFILFCIIMVSNIFRSLTNSVISLDKATRLIAEGDLEKEIRIKGSNEITSLSSSLNAMRLSLQDAQLRRSRFIMGISHDLRTPVAVIKGYTEALSDGVIENDSMKKKAFEIISAKISQLEDMIDDLINFMKLDTGEWRQNLKANNFTHFLQDFVQSYAFNAEVLHKNLTASIDLPQKLMVYYDEKLVLRVFENLVSNAIRYTKENGLIDIKAYLSNEDTIVVAVKDNGIGIAEDELPYIFDHFYRGSNSRREEGSGLGLSVVKNIIDSHGWEIQVSSEKGKGSEFRIIIHYKV